VPEQVPEQVPVLQSAREQAVEPEQARRARAAEEPEQVPVRA